MEQFSRRSFLKGAGLAAVGTAAVGLVGCGSAAAQEQKDWWMPEAWDEETDVVVVGYGAAGVAATITGLDAGLGVITLELSLIHISARGARRSRGRCERRCGRR